MRGDDSTKHLQSFRQSIVLSIVVSQKEGERALVYLYHSRHQRRYSPSPVNSAERETEGNSERLLRPFHHSVFDTRNINTQNFFVSTHKNVPNYQRLDNGFFYSHNDVTGPLCQELQEVLQAQDRQEGIRIDPDQPEQVLE